MSADAGEPPDGGETADAGDMTDAGTPDGGTADGGLQDLAPAGDTDISSPVDGISCQMLEMLAFHIHAHLTIYVNGVQELVPAGIGIGPPLVWEDGFVVSGSCFSWLHTHDESGVIHIESPIQREYTLGNFFDIWGIPLSANQVGPAQGAVTAYLNGCEYSGDITAIPLDAHNVVQLDVGTPVIAPQPYTFPTGL